MNKRIKELAEQAGATILTTHGMEHVVDGCYIIGPARLEKFAELIVKECLDQCYNRGMNDELYNGQLKAAWYIEQHFEVEE